MMWLLSFLPGFGKFIGSLLPSVLDYLNKKQDTALEKYRVGSVNGKEVSIAVIQAELAGRQAQADLNKTAMSHKVYWIAWGLFVLPVAFYHAAIHFVSTFHLVWVVDRVPAMQEQWDLYIVLSLFGVQVMNNTVNRIADAWAKKA